MLEPRKTPEPHQGLRVHRRAVVLRSGTPKRAGKQRIRLGRLWVWTPKLCTMTPERPPLLCSLRLGWNQGHFCPNLGVPQCVLLRRDLHTCWSPGERMTGWARAAHHSTVSRALLMLWAFSRGWWTHDSKCNRKIKRKKKNKPWEKTEVEETKWKPLLKLVSFGGEKKTRTYKAVIVLSCLGQMSTGRSQNLHTFIQEPFCDLLFSRYHHKSNSKHICVCICRT